MAYNKKKPYQDRYIVRVETEKEGRKHGDRYWRVQVTRNKKIIVREYFTDLAYGGKEQALEAARHYRNQIEKEFGLVRHHGFHSFRSTRNKSGVVGVNRTYSTSVQNGRKYKYEVWSVTWVDSLGKRRHKQFSTSVHGDVGALRLALEAREQGIAELLGQNNLTPDSGTQSVKSLIHTVENAKSSQEKGNSLEQLLAQLLAEIEGFSIADLQKRTETEEIDIVVLNQSKKAPYDKDESLILVECKNWSGKCGKNELVQFKEKIENRSGRSRLGFLVSWNGFAETVTLELLRGSREKVVVALLSGQQIKQAVAENNFEKCLYNAWYEAVML